jgi:hypothetical protein
MTQLATKNHGEVLSDAQLWLDLSREYPPDVNRAIPAPMAEVTTEVIEPPAPRPKRIALCYRCGSAPAGNDYAGKFSAYCAICQPVMSESSPSGQSCRCNACGVTFGGRTLFDAHRYGSLSRRRCRTPERMGLVRAPNGVWRTPEDAESLVERVAKMHAGRRS